MSNAPGTEIRGNYIDLNTGTSGGGAAFFSSGVTFVDNVVIDNKAFSEGSGLYLFGGSDVVVRDNRFETNRGGNGGAIACAGGGSALIDRNLFCFNGADSNDGGAIDVRTGAAPTIENNVFIANFANKGGAIALLGQQGVDGPLVRGNTIQGGLANFGTALYTDGFGEETVISSNILIGLINPPVWCGDSFDGGAPSFLNNCFTDGGSGVWTGDCPDPTGRDGNFVGDPMFVDGAAGDYRLTADSPCVDTGEAAWIPLGLDFGGSPRPIDGHLDGVMQVDIGAHELDNVALTGTGVFEAGETVQLTADGPVGGFGLIVFGHWRPRALVSPFGPVFVERDGAW